MTGTGWPSRSWPGVNSHCLAAHDGVLVEPERGVERLDDANIAHCAVDVHDGLELDVAGDLRSHGSVVYFGSTCLIELRWRDAVPRPHGPLAER